MMHAKRDLRKVFMCLVCLGIASGTVTVTPSNTAVVAGDWVAMECRTADGSKVYRWTITQPTSSRKEALFENQNGRLTLNPTYSYGADMDKYGSGYVYLNATQLDDAGLYTCYTSVNDTRPQNSAQLIVFESEPLCDANYTAADTMNLTEGDSIWMQCTVNFRGMWSPTVEWKQHTANDKGEEDEERIVLRGVSTVTMLNASVSSTLIYVGGFTKATYFSCRMFFDWHGGSVQVTATNVPDFNYTWKSPKLVPPQTTAEEVYVLPLPVEVGLFTTTTPSGSNDWYIISLILLAAVLIFVSLLVGLGVQRYMRLRRSRDINQVYNASTSSTVPLRRLEGPIAIEYDITQTATPNIYDRIEGADADDDVAAQETTSQNHNHPLLTQCYSSLTAATASRPCDYDTLDQYEKIDLFNSETDTTEGKNPECSSENIEEERYTTPVPKRGIAKPKIPGSSDYLEMAGDAKKLAMSAPPLYVEIPNDSDEDNYPDGKLNAFGKSNDDYLQPGPKALDNCPKYTTYTDQLTSE